MQRLCTVPPAFLPRGREPKRPAGSLGLEPPTKHPDRGFPPGTLHDALKAKAENGGARRPCRPRAGAALHRRPRPRHGALVMTGPGRPEARSPPPWARGLRRASRAGNTETVVVVPVPGGVPVAVRGPQILRFVVPRAATQHMAFRGRPGSRTSPTAPPDGSGRRRAAGRTARRETGRVSSAGCSRASRGLPSSRCAAPLVPR